jgi:hypothetical protein
MTIEKPLFALIWSTNSHDETKSTNLRSSRWQTPPQRDGCQGESEIWAWSICSNREGWWSETLFISNSLLRYLRSEFCQIFEFNQILHWLAGSWAWSPRTHQIWENSFFMILVLTPGGNRTKHKQSRRRTPTTPGYYAPPPQSETLNPQGI